MEGLPDGEGRGEFPEESVSSTSGKARFLTIV
jgi:hypothetical protein